MNVQITNFQNVIKLYILNGSEVNELNVDVDLLHEIKSKIDDYFDCWEINWDKMQLTDLNNQESYDVGKMQLSIVNYLKNNTNKLITADEIAEAVNTSSKTVRSSMTGFIKKVPNIPVITVHSQGYAWVNLTRSNNVQ